MCWTNSLCILANEDLGTLAEYDPLTGHKPNDYHISETTEQIQESSCENGSLNVTTPSAWRSLLTQEMRAVDELITLKTKVSRPVSRRLSVIERGDPL